MATATIDLEELERLSNMSVAAALATCATSAPKVKLTHDERFEARTQKLLSDRKPITVKAATSALPKSQQTPGGIASYIITLKNLGGRFDTPTYHEYGNNYVMHLANGWDFSTAAEFKRQLVHDYFQLAELRNAAQGELRAAQDELRTLTNDRLKFEGQQAATAQALAEERQAAAKRAADLARAEFDRGGNLWQRLQRAVRNF